MTLRSLFICNISFEKLRAENCLTCLYSGLPSAQVDLIPVHKPMELNRASEIFEYSSKYSLRSVTSNVNTASANVSIGVSFTLL